jgi:hypothetical protein
MAMNIFCNSVHIVLGQAARTRFVLVGFIRTAHRGGKDTNCRPLCFSCSFRSW